MKIKLKSKEYQKKGPLGENQMWESHVLIVMKLTLVMKHISGHIDLYSVSMRSFGEQVK